MQNHIAFGGRGARRGDRVRAGDARRRIATQRYFRIPILAVLAAMFTAAAFAQQTPGKSVYAISEDQVKQEKAQKKEERKEQKAEQKAQKKAEKAAASASDTPEPPPAPVVGQSPPLESAQTETPEEEAEPATVEGTTPPQPRVESQSRADAPPSATVKDPPPVVVEGVLDEAPKPPEVPINSNRPKGLQPVEGKFFLDFEKRSLVDVIAAIGPMVGKNFLLDPTITNQEVTLITHSAIPPDMILEIFESVLTTFGFKLVDTADGNLTKIVPIAEGKDQSEMVISDKPPTGFEGYIFQVVQVKHAAASEVSQLLTEVGSKEAKVTVYERTNMLLLYGTEASIRKMMQLIEEVDQPGFEEDVEFFTLEFTRADVVAQQIQQVLMGDETQGGGNAQPAQGQPVVRQPTPVVRPTRPGASSGGAAATQQVIGTQALTLRITPDERLNALIVVASRPLMVRVRDLIEKLDSPTPPDSNNMHVRELMFADAEFVQEALQGLISGGGGGGLRSSSSRTRTQGSGTAGGRSATSQANLASGGGGGGVAAGGGAAGADIQPFEKSVTITAYQQTNALLIIASPQDYKLLDTVIAQIDKPARQVLVEGIIMEVGIGDEFRLAVETAGLTDNDYFALNNVVSIANVLTQGPLASLDGGGILNFGIIDGTTNIQVPDGNGGSTVQEVNNVPFLLQALESITALDVLSRPSVITVDNEQADVIDGQNIAIPTGSERNLGQGGTTGSSIFTPTEREDVGVIMHVTPQISEGDYVYLDLDIEVSRPIQSTVGIDPNATGVTLAKSNIITKAVVQDGSTGVLGGLLSESTDRARRQTPILGDIPGLGWLFGSKNYGRTKRNLVVLITPHIVKEGIDYDRLTQAQMNKAAAANADVFFEKGLIKKVGKKAKLRGKYRPTDAAMNEVRGISNDLTPTPESLDRGVAPEAQ